MDYRDYFAQLTASVKITMGFDIQFLLKCPILTVFSLIYHPTKVDVLGKLVSYLEIFVLYLSTLK